MVRASLWQQVTNLRLLRLCVFNPWMVANKFLHPSSMQSNIDGQGRAEISYWSLSRLYTYHFDRRHANMQMYQFISYFYAQIFASFSCLLNCNINSVYNKKATTRFCYFLAKWLIISMGRGKMMVEFFSAEIVLSVCR